MAETTVFEPGGYRYVRGRFQYSGGVAAERGYVIERARLARPVPLDEGFRRIETHLGALGRPLTAFCACELRSPGQFTEEGFVAFNRVYVGTLRTLGHFQGRGQSGCAVERLPRGRSAGRTQLSRLFVHRAGRAGRRGGHQEFRRLRLRRSARRARRLCGPDHPSGGHDAGCHAGKGAIRPQRLGASHGGARLDVGERHCEPGLHGPRHPRFSSPTRSSAAARRRTV